MSNHRLIVRVSEHGDTVAVVVTDEESAPIPLVVGGILKDSTESVRTAILDAIEGVITAHGGEVEEHDE